MGRGLGLQRPRLGDGGPRWGRARLEAGKGSRDCSQFEKSHVCLTKTWSCVGVLTPPSLPSSTPMAYPNTGY